MENARDIMYVTTTVRAFMKNEPATNEVAKEVMDLYSTLTDKERADTGTAEYRRRFKGVSEREDYQKLYDLLLRFRLLNALDNVYFVVYDETSSSLVHIIDTDAFDELGFKTGEWEHIKKRI